MGTEDYIPIRRFKTHAAQLLNRVARTGRPMVITGRGKPLARIVPADSDKPICGLLAHTVVKMGDVVSPVCADDWEAAR